MDESVYKNHVSQDVLGITGNETLINRLMRQRDSLQSQLNQVQEALDALQKNPELQKMFDILSKVQHY